MPRPSAEERNLIRTQTDLLRQAQGLTEENIRRRDLLDPLLFEEFGVRPVFAGGADGLNVGGAAIPGATTQPVNFDEGVFSRPAAIGGAVGAGALPGAPTAITPFAPSTLDEGQSLLDAAAAQGLIRQSIGGPLRFVQEGGGGPVLVPGMVGEEIQFVSPDVLSSGMLPQVEQEGPTIGESIGFENIPDTPEELLRQDIERGLLERTQAALRGDLPVDPALERSIAEREAQLRQRLSQQLGTGFETSSPGMEALSRFTRDVEQLRGSARRGDLATAAGFSEAFTTGRERSRALNVAGIMDILGRQAGGAGTLGQVAQAFGAPIGQLAGQRNLAFQGELAQAQAAAQQQQGIGQLLGVLAGGGLGFALGGPPGALVGASLLGGAGGVTPSLVR